MKIKLWSTELQLENAVVSWIKWHKFGVWKTKTKGERHTKNGKEFFKTSQNKGFQDLTCCVKGFFVAIEVKLPGKKQTQNQIDHQKEVEKTGGIYLITHSIEEIEKQFKERNFI